MEPQNFNSKIEDTIISTLKEIATIFELSKVEGLKIDNEKTFSDATSKQGLINTAEALECYFIPYFNVKGIREKFWNGELINLDYIKKGILYLVSDSVNDADNDGALKFSGTPYINFKINKETNLPSGISRNLDFIDSACFVLNALVDAKAINKEKKYLFENGIVVNPKYANYELIPEKYLEKIDNRITDAAKIIKECDLGEGKGWVYTNEKDEPDKEDQLYFTWNALETIEALMIYMKNAPDLLPENLYNLWGGKSNALKSLEKTVYEKRIYLTSKFLSKDNPSLYIVERRVDFGDDDTNYYYNLFSLISLLICGCEETKGINQAFKFLFDKVDNEKVWTNIRDDKHGEFQIAGSLWRNHHRQTWNERAFIALFTKALARYKDIDDAQFVEMLRISGKDINKIFSEFFDKIDNEKVKVDTGNGEVFTNIWDKYKKYSIYYTERVIEALVRLYSVNSNENVKPYYIDEPKNKNNNVISEYHQTSVPITYQINIDKDIVSKELLKTIEEEIDAIIKQKINDLLTISFVTDQLKNVIKETIPSFFDDVYANLRNAKNPKGKTDKKCIDFSETLSGVISELLIKSFSYKVQTISEYEKLKFDAVSFSKNIEMVLEYIARREDDENKPDYGKIVNDALGFAVR